MKSEKEVLEKLKELKEAKALGKHYPSWLYDDIIHFAEWVLS